MDGSWFGSLEWMAQESGPELGCKEPEPGLLDRCLAIAGPFVHDT